MKIKRLIILFLLSFFPLLLLPINANAIEKHGRDFGPNDKMPMYIVSFQRCHSSQACEHFCNGTIVEANWVLTAAHCHINEGDKVGVYDQSGHVNSWPYSIKNVFLPPGVTHTCGSVGAGALDNCFVRGRRMDLALVQLQGAIPLGGQVRKARITNSIPVLEGLPFLREWNMKGWVAGGGNHDSNSNPSGLLKWADARVLDYWSNTNTLSMSVFPSEHDSGGPFMRWLNNDPRSGEMELVGVYSAIYTQAYMTFVGDPVVKTWITATISQPLP